MSFRTDTDISGVGFSQDNQFFLVAAAGVSGVIQLYIHKSKSRSKTEEQSQDSDLTVAAPEQLAREAVGKEAEDVFGEFKMINLRGQANK